MNQSQFSIMGKFLQVCNCKITTSDSPVTLVVSFGEMRSRRFTDEQDQEHSNEDEPNFDYLYKLVQSERESTFIKLSTNSF